MPLHPVIAILFLFQALLLVSSTENKLVYSELKSSKQEIELQRSPRVGKEIPEKFDREISQPGESTDESTRNVQENHHGETMKQTTAGGEENVHPIPIVGKSMEDNIGYDVQGRFSGRKRNSGNDEAVGLGFSGTKQKAREQNSENRKCFSQSSKTDTVKSNQRKSGERKGSTKIKDGNLVQWLKEENKWASNGSKKLTAGEEKQDQWRFGGRKRDNEGEHKNQWRFGGRKMDTEDEEQWGFGGRKRNNEGEHRNQWRFGGRERNIEDNVDQWRFDGRKRNIEEDVDQWRFGGRKRDNEGEHRNQWRFGGRKRNIEEDDVDQWRFSGRKRDTESKHVQQQRFSGKKSNIIGGMAINGR